MIEVHTLAFINVPASPKVIDKGSRRPRVVGDNVRLFIALHEMIHACGFIGHTGVGVATNVMVEKYHAVPGDMGENNDFVEPVPNYSPGFPMNTHDPLPSEVADPIRKIWK